MGRSSGTLHARSWALRIGAVLPLLAAGVTIPPPSTVGAQDAPTVLTFNLTKAAQTWTVPAGVTQATFELAGGQGGKGGFDGGKGAHIVGTIAVVPGEVIQINVGGRGLDTPPSTTACILATNTGGWNGGGDGGNNGNCGSQGGGGATDVRVGGTTLQDRVLVAAGGGGGSGNLACPDPGGGGDPFGQSGSQLNFCSGGGEGANLDGTRGSGQLGQGSVGADPAGFAGPGGGGGGGFFGGGGGAPGLAGGGGSSYGPADTVYFGADHGGDGVAIVTFGGSVPTVAGLQPKAGAAGDTITVVGTNLSVANGATTVVFGNSGVVATCGTPPATSCTVTVPQGSGQLHTHVNVGGQQSLDTDADLFTYVGPAALTSVTPAAAPSGTAVTVAGSGLIPGSVAFRFGTQAATVKSCGAYDSCIVEVPAGLQAGPLEVWARSAGAPGDTNAVPFTVLPGITNINPTRGSAGGGTAVTITGTGFSTSGFAISFGGQPATAIGCAAATTCTGVSPGGSGTVPIRVTVAGLDTPDSPVDQFTYVTGEEQPAEPAGVEVPFDPSDDRVGPDAEPQLQAALAAIQAAPPTSPVLVEGHADSDGDENYNGALSLRRAQAVATWLEQVGGVDVARMAIVATGEGAPLAPEDTPAAKARNRSVVVMVQPGSA